MAYLTVQVSNNKVITDSPKEEWTTINDVRDVKLRSEIGKPRSLVVTIANSDNNRTYDYDNYRRIRCFARRFDVPVFLGRIVRIRPSIKEGMVDLLCADYLHDLAFRSTPATSYDGQRRSEIIKKIISGDGADRRGIFKANTWQQSIKHDIHVEDSAYVEYIQRYYGNDDGDDDTERGDGYEPMLQSINKLSIEDPWQDLQVLRYHGETEVNAFRLYTREALYGAGVIPAPSNQDFIYIGSSKPFFSIQFTPVVTDTDFVYTLLYHNGSTWEQLNIDARDLRDNSAVSRVNLEKRPTVIRFTNADWDDEPNFVLPRGSESSIIDTDSIEGYDSTHPNNTGATQLLNKYWIRLNTGLNRDASLNEGISSITLANNERVDDISIQSKWDYRAEDPVFFDEVWSDSTNVSDRSYYSNNYIDGDDSSGWIYIGSVYPFAGIDFDLDNPFSSSSTPTIQYRRDFGGSLGTQWEGIPSSSIQDNFGLNEEHGSIAWDYPLNNWLKDTYALNRGYLYWVRIQKSSRTRRITTLRTVPNASFKYFERGTEPWSYLGENEGEVAFADVEDKILGTKVDDLWSDSGANSRNSLEVKWRGGYSNTEIPMVDYDIGDNDLEVITRVIVHGRNGVKGAAVDVEREEDLGIIKEKIVTEGWDLSTPAECTQTAELILSQYKPRSLTGFRHGVITLASYPAYKNPGRRPIAIREGDLVMVSIRDNSFRSGNQGELVRAPFLVIGIDFHEEKSKFMLRVSRDLLPIPNSSGDVNNLITALQNKEQSSAWNGIVPSETSLSEIIYHERLGVYRPRARTVLDTDSMDGYSRINYDKFVGEDNNPNIKSNWETNIKQEDSSFIFRGENGIVDVAEDTDGNTAIDRALSDDFADGGVIVYDKDAELFRARIKKGDAGNTLRDMLVGEWGSVTTDSNGMSTITFDSGYSEKPVVQLTIDADNSSLNTFLAPFFVMVENWIQDSDSNYTGCDIQLLKHRHGITITEMTAEDTHSHTGNDGDNRTGLEVGNTSFAGTHAGHTDEEDIITAGGHSHTAPHSHVIGETVHDHSVIIDIDEDDVSLTNGINFSDISSEGISVMYTVLPVGSA